jgi:hypothetical protein
MGDEAPGLPDRFITHRDDGHSSSDDDGRPSLSGFSDTPNHHAGLQPLWLLILEARLRKSLGADAIGDLLDSR